MIYSKDMAPLTNFGKVFWQNQFRTTIDLPDPKKLGSLEGKVAMITGANSGLGFESAKHFLNLGVSRLILAVRSETKGKAAAAELRPINKGATIDVWSLDMESYESIQNFVCKCDKELPIIDYVVLNAGVSAMSFAKVKETGHETTIQVNHFGTALLSTLLLPLLKRSKSKEPARLTIVNSLTAHLCKFPNRNEKPLLASFDDTTLVPWDAQERYGVSKLVNQLFTVKLADHVASEDVTINMVDPGLTKGTQLFGGTSGLLRIVTSLFLAICGRPVDRGAATYIHALLEKGKESHGCFLMSNKISPLAGVYYSSEGDKICKEIWQETMEELKSAGVDEKLFAAH